MEVLFRRAAPQARALFLALVSACAWLAVPAARAAEAVASPPIAADPFEHYQRWRDEPLQDWRKANDRVGEIGGWRTYLRESQQGGDAQDPAGHDPHAH